ncbi:hypothetical protein H4F99_09905 [Lysobacter sp. SG-8]|uniref:Lipoprotein n=1 Tax=Marilutibacter penaei TaxID=2759900 RepID=A0A7W3U4I0_9GAMM|nr:hypothetical protein [Lysobacter penaei]MBB1088804.1 hypothetical protein [Lysobacter penaei]
MPVPMSTVCKPLAASCMLAGALVLVGCQQSVEERLAESAIKAASGQDVQVEQDGERMTISTDQGEISVASGEGVRLPEDFPDDVFLPVDYRVESMLEMAGTQVLSLTAKGDPLSLYADARARMQDQGWKETLTLQQDDRSAMSTFEKDDRNAVISVGAGEDGDVQVGMQLRDRQ